MPDSDAPSSSRLVWRVLRAGVYVGLACTVLFFALTRTDVGRDALRRQLQSAFNERFSGTLHVESLQGTLLTDVIATEVTLRDRSGDLVATIDSVHAEPQWINLLTTELSVQSLTLVEPHLHLHRSVDGTWNARRALSRLSPPTTSDPLLDLSVSHVAVQNGQVTTTRTGDAPALVQDRWLFDYTQSAVDRLSTKVTIEEDDSERRVHVQSLRFRLPNQNLTLRSAEGRITKTQSQWSLKQLALQLGTSRLRAEGTLQPAPSDSGRATADLQLAESRLNHDELRRLVPRLPLRKAVTVEGRLGGRLDRLVVNELVLSHDQSSLRLEGTAFGLPESLDLEAQLRNSRLDPADLRDVWPTAPLDSMPATGPLRLGAAVNGTVQWTDRPRTTFDLDGRFRAQGQPGALRGSLDVHRSSTAALQYAGSLEADSLNVAPLVGDPRLSSRLTGQATIEGSGTTLRKIQSEVEATLSASRIASRRVSAAELQLVLAEKSARGTVSLRQPTGGALTLRGEVDATEAAPLYDVVTSAREFDLAGAHPALPRTRLNATLRTQGEGASWRTLSGSAQLDVDRSQVRRADSTIVLPPHDVSLDVAPRAADVPRVQIGGTVASVTLDASLLGRPLWPSGRLWLTAFQRALDRKLTPPSTPSRGHSSPVISPSLRARAEDALDETDQADPIHLRGAVDVHRMDLLRKWWPRAPRRASALQAKTTLTLSPDTLHTTGTLTSDRLQLGSRRVDTLRASYQLSGALRPALLDGLTAGLSVRADTVQTGGRSLTAPSMDVSLAAGEGTLEAQADGLGRTGPFDLASDVALRTGHVRATIREFYVGAGPHAWISEAPSAVSFHEDAVVVDSLSLVSQRPLTEGVQRIQLHGTFSSAPSDTLHARANDVLIYPLVQLTSPSRSLGGRLNGQIAFTGGGTQPQIRSSFTVHRLSFDRRVLGTLQMQSRITPNTPDLFVDASVVSAADSVNGLLGPPLVPKGPRSLEENRLSVNGRVRLPGWSGPESTAARSSDQLDLTADIDRADLFFFKYIFEDDLAKAQGFTAGTVHIGGRFRDPVFDADLNIRDGYFTLPKFGLGYTANGPVAVDREGIHPRGLRVSDGSGSATIRGSILFNDYKYFSFDLSAELDELRIIDVTDAEDLAFYGQIRASGPASLTGPLSNATLRSERARTTPESELFIPVSEGGVNDDTGFIIFADSTGTVPDLDDLTRRDNILADRPAGEPSFVEGLDIDVNVVAPEGSTVNLVFDPVVGDVVTAEGSGRVQLQRRGGELTVYGNFDITDGSYLFTAGEVFVRRFNISGGTLTWDGPPVNAQLDIEAEYRTRASTAGLPGTRDSERIPVRVLLNIGGRVETPEVDLRLARVRDERENFVGTQALDTILNRSDQTTAYATSVLLTNTFLLTTESSTQRRNTNSDRSLTSAGNQLAFNSVSQLVASQLNRYLGAALPNVDLNFGLQGENPNNLDVIYGVALRLLDERLVIRGEGVYTGNDPDDAQAEGPRGEFVVELRVSNQVSVEAFYRRTGDELTQDQTLTSSTGAGVSYQTEFSTWRTLFNRVFGWLIPGDDEPEESDESDAPPVARGTDGTPAASDSGNQDEDPNK